MVVAVRRGVTVSDSFHRFASWSFLAAIGTIVVWLATGPLFRFSDTWQLVINTGTTIVTFVMVFQSDFHRARATHEARAKRGPLPLGPSNPR
jgi:low affinity Fe/Cu permease